VVNYARRLLSINDQILDLAGPRLTGQTLRIGQTGDFNAAQISLALACFRARRPELRFVLYSAWIDTLLRDMREGDLDLTVWVAATGPVMETRHYWTEELVWLRAPSTRLDPKAPVPLVSYGEECVFTRSALNALRQAGRECEIVFTGSSVAGLAAAVAAGIGVMPFPRSHASMPGVAAWEDAPLPKLPECFCGIYVKSDGQDEDRDLLANVLAAALRPGTPITHADADSAPAVAGAAE
jgi:DNA-binding transcriptional LysR family regulator